MNFHGLRTFVAKLCRRDLRTFFRQIFGAEILAPPKVLLLECMVLI